MLQNISMKKHSKFSALDDSSSEAVKSADMFRKISKCILAYNESEIDEAILDVQGHIHRERRQKMKNNLKQLKLLLHHKRYLLNSRGNQFIREKSLLCRSPTRQSIQRTSHRVKRKVRLNKESRSPNQSSLQKNTIFSFCNEENQEPSTRLKTHVRVATTRKTQYSKHSKPIKCEQLKAFTQNKALLDDLLAKFQQNPKAVTPLHFQNYHLMKRKLLDLAVFDPQQGQSRQLRSATRGQSRRQRKRQSELQRFGTDIQHVLNECSEVLETHYVNLDKVEQAQFIKRYREAPRKLRFTLNTSNAGTVGQPSVAGKCARHGLRRAVPRKTCEEFFKSCNRQNIPQYTL